MKNVIISIKGNRALDNDQEVIELVTNGEYSYSAGETVLSYMESELTGMEGTKTTFHIRPDLVTLTREGVVNSQMVFQEGRKHFFCYHTPYGSATMGVDTRHIRQGLHENGGSMELCYAIDVDHVSMGRTEFEIQVREAPAE